MVLEVRSCTDNRARTTATDPVTEAMSEEALPEEEAAAAEAGFSSALNADLWASCREPPRWLRRRPRVLVAVVSGHLQKKTSG